MRGDGLLLGVLFLGIIAGCSPSPTLDPFKEWGAHEKYGDYVPETAEVVAHGTGPLAYTASEAGTLYVVDTSEMVQIRRFRKPTLIVTEFLRPGAQVVFDPRARQIRIKGRQAAGLIVDPSHNFEMRFDPEERKERR